MNYLVTWYLHRHHYRLRREPYKLATFLTVFIGIIAAVIIGLRLFAWSTLIR